MSLNIQPLLWLVLKVFGLFLSSKLAIHQSPKFFSGTGEDAWTGSRGFTRPDFWDPAASFCRFPESFVEPSSKIPLAM